MLCPENITKYTQMYNNCSTILGILIIEKKTKNQIYVYNKLG